MSTISGEIDLSTPPVPTLCIPSRPQGAVLGRIGTLVVRLAKTVDEVEAAQMLRHRVFASRPQSAISDIGYDRDDFDAYCDHLIVVDTALNGATSSKIVGTYRLLREEQAARAGGFYGQGEFDIAGLAARMPTRRIMELGRSCVLPQYRSKRTIELLWQGIWACCRQWSVDVLCGCASFPGTNPALHALPLSYLHHHARANGDWIVQGHTARRVNMDLMPIEAVHGRDAFNAMPPLVKGYLRVGAMVGDGAVVDYEFGSTDVFVILPVENILARYVSHFNVDANRFA